MKITIGKNSQKPLTFGNVQVGEIFLIKKKIYLKVNNSDTECNAFHLTRDETSEMDFMEMDYLEMDDKIDCIFTHMELS